MKIAKNPIGGLRDISIRLLFEECNCSVEWLSKGTKLEEKEAREAYNALGLVQEKDEIVSDLVLATKQAAFERGMQTGARLALELFGGDEE